MVPVAIAVTVHAVREKRLFKAVVVAVVFYLMENLFIF